MKRANRWKIRTVWWLCQIYIGGLRSDSDKYDVEEAFAQYGKVEVLLIVKRVKLLLQWQGKGVGSDYAVYMTKVTFSYNSEKQPVDPWSWTPSPPSTTTPTTTTTTSGAASSPSPSTPLFLQPHSNPRPLSKPVPISRTIAASARVVVLHHRFWGLLQPLAVVLLDTAAPQVLDLSPLVSSPSSYPAAARVVKY